MPIHAGKTAENTTLTATATPRQQNSPASLPFQEMADNSPRVRQLAAYQDMADGSPQLQQAAQLQAMADSYRDQTPNINHQIPNPKNQVPNTKNQIPATNYQLPNTNYQLPNTTQLKAKSQKPKANSQQPITKSQQPKSQNNTGLPDNLKSGIENLSGYAMDDVNVHYNSPKPARLHAHAYTQGTDIHVAPGQEKHLPEEGWHALQQKQRRVQPTIQLAGNIPVNDDTGLEKEAVEMGAKALTYGGNSTNPKKMNVPANSGSNPIQMAVDNKVENPPFTSYDAPKEETAVKIINNKTGVGAGNMNLPAKDLGGNGLERAKSITATIDKSTVGDTPRDSNSILSKVTGMARNEAFLLLGVDPQNFYHAGHLIGDQLVKKTGKDVSFILQNLAPQVAEFNSPAYLNVMENPIKEQAEKGKTIEAKVDIEYPGQDYTVPMQTIIDRGIVKIESQKNQKVKFNGAKNEVSENVLNENIQIPRRIPNKWTMTAKEFSPVADGESKKSLDKFDIDKKKGSVQQLLPSSTSSAELNEVVLSVNDRFKFIIKGMDKDGAVNPAFEESGENIAFKEVKERILEAKQWTPPREDEITDEELKGAIALFFPDVAIDDKKLNDVFGNFKEADFEAIQNMNERMFEIMEKITGESSLSFEDFKGFKTDFFKAMDNAKKSLEGGDKNGLTIYLAMAKLALDQFKNKTDEAIAQSKELKEKMDNELEELREKKKELSEFISSEQYKKFFRDNIDAGLKISIKQSIIGEKDTEASQKLVKLDFVGALQLYIEIEALIKEIWQIITEKEGIEKEDKGKEEEEAPQSAADPSQGGFSTTKSLTLSQSVPELQLLPEPTSEMDTTEGPQDDEKSEAAESSSTMQVDEQGAAQQSVPNTENPPSVPSSPLPQPTGLSQSGSGTLSQSSQGSSPAMQVDEQSGGPASQSSGQDVFEPLFTALSQVAVAPPSQSDGTLSQSSQGSPSAMEGVEESAAQQFVSGSQSLPKSGQKKKKPPSETEENKSKKPKLKDKEEDKL